MAVTVLFHDESADGILQVDYDSTGRTIGHTCTLNPGSTATGLLLTVTEVDTTTGLPTGVTFHKDVSADFGLGRVVDLSNVAPNRVPVHVKGQIYPYDFDTTWVHPAL